MMTQARAKQAGQAWDELADEVFVSVWAWREQHPRATFKELETALDERLARLRARLLTDTALRSAAADLREQPAAARPACPDCGGRLVLAGQEERVLTTTFDHGLALTRSAMECTACHRRVFPPG